MVQLPYETDMYDWLHVRLTLLGGQSRTLAPLLGREHGVDLLQEVLPQLLKLSWCGTLE